MKSQSQSEKDTEGEKEWLSESAECGSEITGDDGKEIVWTKTGSFDCRKVVVSLLGHMFRTYWGCYRPSVALSLSLQYRLWRASAALFEMSSMHDESLHYLLLSLDDDFKEWKMRDFDEDEGEEGEEGDEDFASPFQERKDRFVSAVKGEIWLFLEKYVSKTKSIIGSISSESLGIRSRLLLKIFAFCQRYFDFPPSLNVFYILTFLSDMTSFPQQSFPLIFSHI